MEKHFTDRTLSNLTGRSPSYWKRERLQRRLRFKVIELPGSKKPSVQIPESAVTDWYQRYAREIPSVADVEAGA